MTELVHQEPAAAPAGPEPTMRGRFSLYDTPDGGFHVAYRADGAEEDSHFEVPGVLVTIAREAQESGTMPNPMKLMKALMGSRKA